ncbi:MAG: DUF2304 domain-containing protein [Myxococcota bacterium]
MIPFRLQVAGIAVLSLLLVWFLWLVRTGRVSLREGLSWLLSTLAALAFTIYPELLAKLAEVLEIEIASNALFALAILYMLVNLMTLTIATSVSARNVRRLTQECALLRAEIDSIRQGQAPSEGGETS